MRIQRYTDKYFTRTRLILEKEGLNPKISMVVFARGGGKVAGLAKTASLVKDCAQAKVYITAKKEFSDMMPLMLIKARAQDIIELETIYLGVLSDELSRANGFSRPEPESVRKKFEELKSIYRGIPITYFGARHYHYSLDKEIAAAALDGGAIQTSTDEGSSNINRQGVGTMPHLLPIILARYHGKANATLKSAELFDRYIDKQVPRIVLVDTFAKEITDSLAVAEYFKGRCMVRIDTNSESVGEGQSEKGVTPGLVNAVRKALDMEYRNTGIFLSGGFGDEAKAMLFMKAYDKYMQATGRKLFEGVGIGAVTDGVFCTADCIEVDGHGISKAGRAFGASGLEEYR